MASSLLEPPDRVLSTLNQDGSRRWLRPRVSRGAFLRWRRVTAYALIAVFTLIPYAKFNGKPLVLLDIIKREFTLFGKTFLPTDTLLLALLMISIFVAIFLATAMLGRVWCGWMCPQTVYLEFVYRPIERLLGGQPGRRKPTTFLGLRRVVKALLYMLVSAYLAHTFLSYFVGVDNLRRWIFHSPLDHPAAFLVAAFITGLMLIDFGYFREQMCIVACPYGRLQSVLLDRSSLIVGYDRARGEPRGRARRGAKRGSEGDISLDVLADDPGDCVDCDMCVTTCPTGIDIREGLQMECVACAQCIDACDTVMTKLGRPKGLIRYASQDSLDGKPRKLLRPRVVLYPAMLLALVSAFVFVLVEQTDAEIKMLRSPGMPYNMLEDGMVSNAVRVRVTNRTDTADAYWFEPVGIEGVTIISQEIPFKVGPGKRRSALVQIVAPASVFENGWCDIRVLVSDGADFELEVGYRLLGPTGSQGGTDG